MNPPQPPLVQNKTEQANLVAATPELPEMAGMEIKPEVGGVVEQKIVAEKKERQQIKKLNFLLIGGLAAIILIMGGIFAWFYQQSIVNLAVKNEEINLLGEQLEQSERELDRAVEMQLLQESLPVYVDSGGKFSFYQDFEGLRTRVGADGVIRLTYGIMDQEDEVTEGFEMIIEEKNAQGETVLAIAEETWLEKTGESYFDLNKAISQNGWRDEGSFLGDVYGYSFVAMPPNYTEDELEEREEEGLEIITDQIFYYFLRKNVGAGDEYLQIQVIVRAEDPSEYAYYEGIATIDVLQTLEIY